MQSLETPLSLDLPGTVLSVMAALGIRSTAERAEVETA